MIFVAGAGAMAEAAKAMRRIQRDLNRRIEKTKRRARGRRRIKVADYQPESVDFPCVYLCATCGYFLDESVEEAQEKPCPVCQHSDWLDLAYEPIADRIRDLEAEERMRAPTKMKVLAVALAFLATAAVFGALVLVGSLVSYPYPAEYFYFTAALLVPATLFILPVAYMTLPRPLAARLLSGDEQMPYRWRVPLGLPDPDEAASRRLRAVRATAAGETIEAPISGRECLAYQVCVLFDTAGDARPPEWALQEQRATSVVMDDGLEISGEALFLETPVERVPAPGGGGPSRLADDDVSMPKAKDRDAWYDDIKRFLRKRGLFITDGSFHFYEARLEPGDEVDVESYADEQFVVRHTSAASEDDLPLLPQPNAR